MHALVAPRSHKLLSLFFRETRFTSCNIQQTNMNNILFCPMANCCKFGLHMKNQLPFDVDGLQLLCLTCDECEVRWAVCQLCNGSRQRKHITTRAAALDHYRLIHEPESSKRQRLEEPGDEDMLLYEDEEFTSHAGLVANDDRPFSPKVPWLMSSCISQASYQTCHPILRKFFYRNENSEPRSIAQGIGYVVARAQIREPSACDSIFHEEDQSLFMDIAHLGNSLSPTNLALFATILGKMDDRAIKARDQLSALQRSLLAGVPIDNSRDPHDIKLRLSVPRTTSDFRRMVTEGSHSILKNLPLPQFEKLEDGHVVCPLTDILALLFAFHGDGVVPLNSTNNPFADTIKGKALIHRCKIQHPALPNTVCLDMTLWTDDCDCSSSVATANRFGLWIMICCIAMGRGEACYQNSFPVAFGPSGVNHSPALRYIKAQVERVNGCHPQKYYFSKVGVDIAAHAEIFCFLADSPEARKLTGISSYNSALAPRWRMLSSITRSNFSILRSGTFFGTGIFSYEDSSSSL